MATVDAINRRHGSGALRWAAEGYALGHARRPAYAAVHDTME